MEFIRECEEEKLHQFVMGLDDVMFGMVQSQILNMDPLPTINKAYALITLEERHRSIVCGQEERIEGLALTSQAMTRQSSGPYYRQSKQRANKDRKCTYFNKSIHEISKCFEVIKYPSW